MQKKHRQTSATHGLSGLRGVALGIGLGLGIAGAVACGTTGKEAVAKTAIDALTPEQRAETFEATLRILDDKPELVDQVYELTKKHEKVLERVLADAAPDLKDKPMATLAAKHLVEYPDSVETMLVVSIPWVAKTPPARAAMDRAVIRTAEGATDILTDDPATVARVLETALGILEKKPQARKAVLAAVHKDRAKILAFVKEDPALMKELGEEIVRELVKDKPTVEKMLRAAKVIEDSPLPPPPAAPGAPGPAAAAPSVPASKP